MIMMYTDTKLGLVSLLLLPLLLLLLLSKEEEEEEEEEEEKFSVSRDDRTPNKSF